MIFGDGQKHDSLQLGPIQSSSPSTQELHDLTLLVSIEYVCFVIIIPTCQLITNYNKGSFALAFSSNVFELIY